MQLFEYQPIKDQPQIINCKAYRCITNTRRLPKCSIVISLKWDILASVARTGPNYYRDVKMPHLKWAIFKDYVWTSDRGLLDYLSWGGYVFDGIDYRGYIITRSETVPLFWIFNFNIWISLMTTHDTNLLGTTVLPLLKVFNFESHSTRSSQHAEMTWFRFRIFD